MDSIAAAILLARDFDRIHLLTCRTPYILGCRAFTAGRVKDLKTVLNRTELSQSFADTFETFRKLGPRKAARDARSSLLVCTVCKTAMHLKAIEICRREGLEYASSGIGVREQQNFPDQLPELESRVNALYAGAGIKRLSPLKKHTKVEVKSLLDKHYLFPRFRIPRCPIKNFQELWWLFFGFPRDERILEWYDSKLPVLKRIIRDTGCEIQDAG